MTPINKCLNCTEEKESSCNECLKNENAIPDRIKKILNSIEEGDDIGYDYYSLEKGYY